jgi:hypothetical protein
MNKQVEIMVTDEYTVALAAFMQTQASGVFGLYRVLCQSNALDPFDTGRSNDAVKRAIYRRIAADTGIRVARMADIVRNARKQIETGSSDRSTDANTGEAGEAEAGEAGEGEGEAGAETAAETIVRLIRENGFSDEERVSIVTAVASMTG